MPSPNPTTRREFKGAAAGTALQNSMTSSDTTFVLVAANNWPTGGVGKFVVTINRGQADEEKILCDTQSSRNVACLLANRGFDGTTAQGHAAGATVECTISAFDADEWNAHTNATTGVHGVAGAVVGTTDAQTLTNKTLTAPTVNGATLDAASTVGGVSGTTLAADHAAWIAYTPTVTGITNLGDLVGRYKQVGKTVTYHIFVQTSGSSTFSSTFTFTLPVGTLNNGRTFMQVGTVWCHDAVNFPYLGGAVVTSAGGSTIQVGGASGGYWGASSPFTWAASLNQIIAISGTYEAA